MKRAVKYCSCDWLIFGTDCVVSSKPGVYKGRIETDEEILGGEPGLPGSEREKHFSGNLMELLGEG